MKILKQLATHHTATLEELVFLLEDEHCYKELLKTADQVRKTFVGDEVHLRAIIEFSSYCRCHCQYCGMRSENQELERFRLSENDIITIADEAIVAGYQTLVLQSAEDLFWSAAKMAQLVTRLKQKYPQVALTISIGERPSEDYRLIKDAGADRFLIKHEISDSELYQQLHQGDALANRLQATQNLIDLGFQTGGGIMIGLPSQTSHTLASDLLLMQKLGLNMISVGPFIPHPATPLGNYPHGNLILVLRAAALARLLCPYALIPSTSAFIALTGKPELMLQAGANVLMQKAEPLSFQRLYSIYPKPDDERTIAQKRADITKIIETCGRKVAQSRGDYPLMGLYLRKSHEKPD